MLALIWMALLSAPETGEDTQILDRLAGEYQHAGGDEDQRALEAAIDRTVGAMMWIARGIARSRLRETNQIPRSLRIVRAGERVKIQFDGHEREAIPRMPPITVVGMTGDELAYTLAVERNTLVQRFEGERGGRINSIRVE